MISSLANLKAGLTQSFIGRSTSPETWSAFEDMARAGQRVRQEHGGASIVADTRSILVAVAAFEKTGKISGFRDLKYVCLGMGAIDEEGWSILADEVLRGIVARTVEQQSTVHRQLRCFQALLSTYFSFPFNSEEASQESKKGWQGLRAWLRAERDRIADQLDFKPPWFEVLLRHPELLTNQPCDKFGSDLLDGDASSLKDAKDGLSIPENSWVIDETVFAQMTAAGYLKDAQFKTALSDLLAIAMGRRGISISKALKIRCVASLVSRYARCSDRPEQPALRDAATLTIGNPWLDRTNWDAWVRTGNKSDDQAREMVFYWLKERLVSDFFELLSAEGINDRRRVAYWLRFVPFVDDMWFVLGTTASARRGSKFGEFRERAKGRLLRLDGTTADNNAFVMRIGEYLAVEFGSSGNAFYLFQWNSLSPSLLESLNSARSNASVHIADIRGDNFEDRIRHADSPVSLKSWEQKFDERLIKRIGKQPKTRAACVPELEVLVTENHIKVADLRGSGGALCVYETDRSSHLSRQLQAWGFSYRAGRGWFKE